MGRRSVRISLFVLALLATAGLGYRAVTDESQLSAERQQAATIDRAAEEALSALLDVRGSLHAYVAPSQGTEFWGKRAGAQLDALRQHVVTLDAAVAPSGGSLADSLDGIDQLAAADRRARQYADRGEFLLAGDVLFTEVRDLLRTVTEQVVSVRYTLRSQAEARASRLRQEQAALAAGGIGLWIFVSMLLMPGSVKTAAKSPEWRQVLAEKLEKPASAQGVSEEPRRDLADSPAGASAKPEAPAGGEAGPLPEPGPVVVAEPLPAPVAQIDLKIVAEICADLSALSDAAGLQGALARASDVLGAKGLIVWVASSDGSSLSAGSTHGFDARIVNRIGAIDRASANLTAEALRENAPKISAATATAAAALAVPMRGPAGPVGVLSAELQPGKDADETRVAVALILAAQLATLTAPLPEAAGTERKVGSAAS
jgi:hypothetical protein